MLPTKLFKTYSFTGYFAQQIRFYKDDFLLLYKLYLLNFPFYNGIDGNGL
jgi:hypothetical protein